MRFSHPRSWFPTISALALFACVTANAGAQTAAERFAGTYKEPRLTVVIVVDGPSCNGIIIMGEQRFPLTGHVEEGTLHGNFISDGNKFEFTATLAGSEMTLVTGGTTYVLKNANPLARGPGPAATAPSAPAKAGSIVGKWAISGDLGGEKFTLTIGPKGEMDVESSNGNSTSGPTCAYADNTLTFDGGITINKLSLAGTWKITWKDQDTFTTVDDQGKALALHRMK